MGNKRQRQDVNGVDHSFNFIFTFKECGIYYILVGSFTKKCVNSIQFNSISSFCSSFPFLCAVSIQLVCEWCGIPYLIDRMSTINFNRTK